MTSPLRSLWDAPAAVPPPPRRVWRDWALVGVLAPLIVLEAALRPNVPWVWLWAAVLLALLPTLLWRRTRPFTMLAVAFGAGWLVGLLVGGDAQLFCMAYFLLLVYAAMRWGSGRAILGGGALLAVGWTTALFTQPPTVGDVVGSIAVVVTTTSLGFAFRWRARARTRELDQVRLREREHLARDLHDTVAHHVSAIAIQAQAGTAVASTDPDAAARVLRVIEGEASRTLDEMRSMVRVLRDGEAADLTPVSAIADLTRLADTPGGPPAVHVRLTGEHIEVGAATGAAVFRIAQEAVTNARRHAHHATRIDVTAAVDAAGVRLEVHDDGRGEASARPGYGITGMIERAALLGGACHAGPVDGGGWTVTATLPRNGGAL